MVLKPSRPISVSFPSAEKRGELNGQPVLNPRKEKERKKETEKGRRERKKGERERGGCLYSALRSHAQIIVNAAKNVSRLDVRSGLHCRTQPAPRSSCCPNRPPSPRLTGFNPVTAASLSSFFTLFTLEECSQSGDGKKKVRQQNLSPKRKDSACSLSYSRNAVVSISVVAAVGWAEMIYVWRETPTTPLPPSLKLHFSTVAAVSG